MAYVDIGIIVIVSLCALIGLIKGAFKTILGFFSWTVSLVIAFFLTKTIAETLLDVEALRGFVIGSEGFSLFGIVKGMLPENWYANEFMKMLFADSLKTVAALAGEGVVSTADGMAMVVTYGLFSAIVCLGLFIVARIVMMLFSMFAKHFSNDESPKALSRLIGFLVGAVRGAAYVAFIFLLATYALAIPALDPVNQQLKAGVISKPLIEHVSSFSEKLSSNDDGMLSKLIEYSGLKSSDDDGDGGSQGELSSEQTELKNLLQNFMSDMYGADKTISDYQLENPDFSGVNYSLVKLDEYLDDAASSIKNNESFNAEDCAELTNSADGLIVTNASGELKDRVKNILDALQDAIDKLEADEGADVSQDIDDIESMFEDLKDYINGNLIGELFGNISFTE